MLGWISPMVTMSLLSSKLIFDEMKHYIILTFLIFTLSCKEQTNILHLGSISPSEHSGVSNGGTTEMPENPATKILAFAHIHANTTDGTYSVFSFSDIRRFSRALHKGDIKSNDFVAFLATKKGTYFALTINNSSKLLDFFYYWNNENLTGADALKGLESERIADIFQREYYRKEDALIQPNDPENEDVLGYFLNFLTEADFGITLFETDANFNEFSKVSKANYGDVDRDPCN